MLRSLVPFTFALTLAATVAACSQSQGQVVTPAATSPGSASAAGSYPARLPLAGGPQPLDVAPLQPEGGVWQSAGEQLNFAVPGQQPLLSLACLHDAGGVASLKIARTTRAEDGAKALFALIGNGRIARLPVDAVQPGESGRWEGTIPVADLRLDVLKGGAALEATLPGGGTLKLPASPEPGRLLEACRASDAARAPAAA